MGKRKRSEERGAMMLLVVQLMAVFVDLRFCFTSGCSPTLCSVCGLETILQHMA